MRKTLAVLIFLSLATPALAGTMYARFSAPVRSGRGLSAGILGRLEQGDPVDVQAREGRYYRISYKGKAAYIYYNKLAKEKPEDISDLLGGAGSGGIELTEIKAGGAIRGLSPMAENYAQASDIPGWAVDAVEAMQARSITVKELEQFQKEGQLGEYGEEGSP